MGYQRQVLARLHVGLHEYGMRSNPWIKERILRRYWEVTRWQLLELNSNLDDTSYVIQRQGRGASAIHPVASPMQSFEVMPVQSRGCHSMHAISLGVLCTLSQVPLGVKILSSGCHRCKRSRELYLAAQLRITENAEDAKGRRNNHFDDGRSTTTVSQSTCFRDFVLQSSTQYGAGEWIFLGLTWSRCLIQIVGVSISDMVRGLPICERPTRIWRQLTAWSHRAYGGFDRFGQPWTMFLCRVVPLDRQGRVLDSRNCHQLMTFVSQVVRITPL